jgi:tryptophan 2-monooxygenase
MLPRDFLQHNPAGRIDVRKLTAFLVSIHTLAVNPMTVFSSKNGYLLLKDTDFIKRLCQEEEGKAMDQRQRLHRHQLHSRRHADSYLAARPQPSLAQKPLPAGGMGWSYIDTLYDYVQFLSGGDHSPHAGSIAALPKTYWKTPVAIIGAGAAGLVAAYELLKIGASPVVFEADPHRLGGRAYSLPFTDGQGHPDPSTFAEMGAMRFPASSRLLFHYANAIFGLQTVGTFPNPGQVPTKLSYENRVIDWRAGQSCPACFEGVSNDWQDFTAQLMAPLRQAWQNQDMGQVVAIWQSYIDQYKDLSFSTAVRRGIAGWTERDMNTFGALGIGSGGFGPLYPVGFLEILRIVVNGMEQEQQLLVDGSSAFLQAFFTQPVTLPNGEQRSLQSMNAVLFKTPVTAVTTGADGNPLVYYTNPSSGKTEARSFPAVIVATTTRCMRIMGMTREPPGSQGSVVHESVKTAIRTIPLMNSSKMFIRTATKFWKSDPRLPQNIQMDELPRGVYALDYPQTENGVILISYTWGEDSRKLLGLSKEERFALFKRAIAHVSPAFSAHLVPLNGEILTIDWQATDYHYGAFKLQYPGQEQSAHDLYYQFLTVLNPAADRGVYLAGDSVSWSGGWLEGALQTGINAACAAAKRIGALLVPASPLSQSPHLYTYSSVPTSPPTTTSMAVAACLRAVSGHGRAPTHTSSRDGRTGFSRSFACCPARQQ